MSHLSLTEACSTLLDTLRECTAARPSNDCLHMHAQLSKLQPVLVQCGQEQFSCRNGSCGAPAKASSPLKTPIPGLEHLHAFEHNNCKQIHGTARAGGTAPPASEARNGVSLKGAAEPAAADAQQPHRREEFGAELIVRNCLKVRCLFRGVHKPRTQVTHRMQSLLAAQLTRLGELCMGGEPCIHRLLRGSRSASTS